MFWELGLLDIDRRLDGIPDLICVTTPLLWFFNYKNASLTPYFRHERFRNVAPCHGNVQGTVDLQFHAKDGLRCSDTAPLPGRFRNEQNSQGPIKTFPLTHWIRKCA